MAVIGLDIDRKNPPYTIDDFSLWIPEMDKFIHTEEGVRYFNKLYPIADRKVFYSVFGSDWEYAVSLVIAHYLTLIGRRASRPKGSTLAEASSGQTAGGVLTSVSVGGFSKSYDFNLTATTDEANAKFWNQTEYGLAFYSLWQTKAQPSMFVVTNGNPYDNQIDDDRHKSIWDKIKP